MEIKNICCIGAGFVGCPTMAVLSKYCPDIVITLVDVNQEKINAWNSNNCQEFPVYEEGLAEIILNNRGKNLFFSCDIKNSIKSADMVFISVNTPTKKVGFGAGYASDLKWVESSARSVASYSQGHTIVVEKSTVPVRTAELIKIILKNTSEFDESNNKKTFSIISSPEFLAEGTAICDLENPDRVLIGGEDKNALNILSGIYKRWIAKEKILYTNLWSSELAKLTANAFLAQRISSINSISALCEVTGAEITEVSNAIGLDSRIGQKFLSASAGFGGSCFQKDILNLVYLCNFYGLKEVADYWEQVLFLNNWQRERIAKIIIEKLFGTVSFKKIVLLGFSFKANTNDTRESSAIYIAKYLKQNGANVIIHDPKVSYEEVMNALDTNNVDVINEQSEGNWGYYKNIMEAVKDADAIVILTDWPEYYLLDWNLIADKMRKPSWLFDTRSIINRNQIENTNINYWGIGSG